MAASRKNPTVEIISKEMIKPLQPTPSHLQTYQTSSLDQFSNQMSYIRVVYFYDNLLSKDNNHVIQVNLKKSLSETLTLYYPLAGKFTKDYTFIECDDSGAEFTTAIMTGGDYYDCFGIIENLNIDFLEKLVSKDDNVTKSDDVILAIQITQFKGGHCTVGVCISHKISDASTLCSFLKCWSAAANIIFSGKSNFKELIPLGPILDAPKLWPSIPGLCRPSSSIIPKREKLIMQKLSFSSSSLSKLKFELSGGEDEGEVVVPTRVTSIMALLWHVIMNSSSPQPPSSDKHVFIMPVNIRGKMSPPLPEKTFGNVVKLAAVGKSGGNEITPPSWLTEVRLLLGLIKEIIGKVDAEYAKMQAGSGLGPFTPVVIIMTKNLTWNVTFANSWCRLGFNDVNFGISKPISMMSLTVPTIRNMLLLDGPNEGIDVLIKLNEGTMEKFLKNPILLSFCDNSITYG